MNYLNYLFRKDKNHLKLNKLNDIVLTSISVHFHGSVGSCRKNFLHKDCGLTSNWEYFLPKELFLSSEKLENYSIKNYFTF